MTGSFHVQLTAGYIANGLQQKTGNGGGAWAAHDALGQTPSP